MSTFYSPGCKNNKAHICNCCEIEDGRSTLYWEKEDFDLCFDCLKKLFIEYCNIDRAKIKVQRITIPESLRNKIFKRDNYQCKKCGNKIDLTIDHIIPFWRGGMSIESNLQTLCRKCNSRKGIFIDGK